MRRGPPRHLARSARRGDGRRSARRFAPNGYTMTALQAAWAAISSAPGDGPVHLTTALLTAVRSGHDTDTVATIAGGLVGARWGASAVPREWSRLLHG
nr:ADP-ribosylglycohydrolase family protein [Aeromicrobium sp. PE09-221]